jgi:hypothetical protein
MVEETQPLSTPGAYAMVHAPTNPKYKALIITAASD